ncbi:LysR family transcriptional regulator [Vreelandella gomseomensis]|uniref:LysR family transcriptional regulator n=1 Tax=Vreelandella gomseomensis TaxID=370766 RepID=A0ABU1GDB6_9GAMM|nr:LysR family transcriptional regulator [Halomonas gomseomensis]MDR5875484.1 LysR family transcriptional regulator [Halomonas gomseomensis]
MSILRDQRLRIFYTVAVCENFTKAAERLCLTQQAVSFQIKSLEDSVGIVLFSRTSRRVLLTPAGEIVFAHAKKILLLYEEAERQLDFERNKNSDTLRIAATHSIAKYKLPEVISKFKETSPNVKIDLLVGNSSRVMEYVSAGLVEVGFTSDGALNIENFRITPFFRDEVTFVVSHNHPWATIKSVSIQDFVKSPLISREEGSGTRALLQRHLAALSLSLDMLNIVLVVGSPEAAKESAEAGLGIGMISKLCSQPELDSNKLVQIEIAGLRIIRDFYVVRLVNGMSPPAVDEFLTLARGKVHNGIGR